MRLYIQEKDSLLKFNLPAKVDGSMLFSFKSSSGRDNSINIDAVDGKWVFKSNGNINIISSNNSILDSVPLVDYMCVPVSVTGESGYLCIFCLPSIEENSFNYPVDNLTNITIGKSSDNNIVYQQNMMADHHAVIKLENGNWFLYPTSTDSNVCIYVNNQRVLKPVPIFIGDIIFMNGLRIVWMKKSFIIPMAGNLYQVNGITCINSDTFQKNTDFTPTSEVDKNILLYNENDYFSHTPRIRSVLEEEEIKVDAPPAKGDFNTSMPFLLSIASSFTMLGMMFTNGFALYNGLTSGEKDVVDFLPQIIMIVAMIGGSVFVPFITRKWENKEVKRKEEFRQKKYNEYLCQKEKEIVAKKKKQEQIVLGNFIDINGCLHALQNRTQLLWNRIIKDSDFIEVRLGVGNRPALFHFSIPDEKFSLDDDELYNSAVNLRKKYDKLENVPITISLKDQIVTSFILQNTQKNEFINGILLQLLTFHSPLDLKIVVFTSSVNSYKWNYLKYTQHNWSDDHKIRFFATNQEELKNLCQYLDTELLSRRERKEEKEKENKEKSKDDHVEEYELYDSYYLIITDNFKLVQNFKFVKDLLGNQFNFGFSMMIIDKDMKNIPNECEKFLIIGDSESGMLNSTVSEEDVIKFNAEYAVGLNMRRVGFLVGNIPVQSKNEDMQLPTRLSFLQMYNVGKIEQLNIRNRWATSDPMSTLEAPIGVHTNGELFYLNLHEKNDGPHGLIAGSTGSGKSEFIITYLLSMALNYDPKEVQFVLIDYKGGGLTGAFENRELGISIPHLAGTITNLDVSEMNRTLVSIESELKRRQHQFNVVKEQTGESTMDIYKYQRLYREGVIDEPVSHLFIVSDEFAELKAQQPEFMDQLVSTARIGRSLGVHLILATQKPSGVVNDQIWSNSKFKVCLKVATVEDSREMLKRPEAASIKEAGRFYLQIGYDEYFDIGQSAWAGEKYVPSERIIKKADDSVSIVNNYGNVIKKISYGKSEKVKTEDRGDQLTNIVKYLYNIAKEDGFVIKKLWLPSLKEIIVIDRLIEQYSISKPDLGEFKIAIGEYDAPALQKQGPVIHDFLSNGNTAIYGNDGSERESFINAIVYSTAKNFTTEAVNLYFIDYGSESLRMFQNLPQVGGMVFTDELDRFDNLVKLIQSEVEFRKELLINYGGEYINYIKKNPNKLPLMIVIINNYEAFNESNDNVMDIMPKLVRDSERYGIVFLVTAGGINALNSRILQSFHTSYALKLKDAMDYGSLFEIRSSIVPKNVFGRGIISLNGSLNEFQVGSLVEDVTELNDFVMKFVDEQNSINKVKAKPIPQLPEFVRFEDVKGSITSLSLSNVPVGISKRDLSTLFVDFISEKGFSILSKKVTNTLIFVKSLLSILKNVPNTNLIIVDAFKELKLNKEIFPNYYDNHFENVSEQLESYVDNSTDNNNNNNQLIIIYGFSKYVELLGDVGKFEIFINKIKLNNSFRIIIVDDGNHLKSFAYESWFSSTFNLENGIWIGNGFYDQSVLKTYGAMIRSKENIDNSMGYLVHDGEFNYGRMIDFVSKDESSS